MKITSAVYKEGDAHYPLLDLVIDGKPAHVYTEQLKKPLVDAGFIFLGAEWERILPPIDLPAGAASNANHMTLRGFTTDPEVVRLVRQFIDDLENNRFRPGMVLI